MKNNNFLFKIDFKTKSSNIKNLFLVGVFLSFFQILSQFTRLNILTGILAVYPTTKIEKMLTKSSNDVLLLASTENFKDYVDTLTQCNLLIFALCIAMSTIFKNRFTILKISSS